MDFWQFIRASSPISPLSLLCKDGGRLHLSNERRDWQTCANPYTEELKSTSAGIKMELLQTWLHLVPLRNTLKNLLVKSPAPERQVKGDALGSVQGKKAQGFTVQLASMFWRAAGVEHERERKRGSSSFSGCVFCSI